MMGEILNDRGKKTDLGSGILLLTNSIEEFVETVGHHHVHANEVVDWLESTRREVTLLIAASCISHSASNVERYIPCTGQACNPQLGACPEAW